MANTINGQLTTGIAPVLANYPAFLLAWHYYFLSFACMGASQRHVCRRGLLRLSSCGSASLALLFIVLLSGSGVFPDVGDGQRSFNGRLSLALASARPRPIFVSFLEPSVAPNFLSQPPTLRQQLPPPTASSVAAASPSPSSAAPRRLILLTRNDFGRYSNQREVLLETLALALFAGRDVAVDPPPACRGGGLGYAYDVPALEAALGVRVLADGPSAAAAAHCAGATGRGALLTPVAGRHGGWGAPGSFVSWAGLSWPVLDAGTDSDAAAAVPPNLLAQFGSAETAFGAPAYRDLRNPDMAYELPAYLGPPGLPAYVASAAAPTCLALSVPFYAVNVALMPGAYERAAAALRPVPWLAAAAEAWLESRGLPRRPGMGGLRVAALHVRLTDNLRRGVKSGRPWVDRCDDAATREGAVAEVRAFFEARGLLGATVLFATDDAASPCTAALLDAFSTAPARIFVDRPDGDAAPRVQDGDCLHSQFIQEVLARSDAFFGSALSTFSTAVHQIRVLQHARPLNSSLML